MWLEVNYLQVWVHEVDETLVAVTKDDEETVAEVLNCRRAEYLLEDDSKNEEMCELETPKINKVLDDISEVMNWVERQSDCDHPNLLRVQNIKMYLMKKRHQLSCQNKMSDYYKNIN
jgi:hypothetical protein